MNCCIKLIDKLEKERMLDKQEFKTLIDGRNEEISKYLFERSRVITDSIFSKSVYVRGLIEFTSYCKNNCLYCGLRRGNKHAERYRLTKEKILECCDIGHKLGFRTFVLQGGEDLYFNDDMIVDIVMAIKNKYPETALTLSIGEKSYDAYKRFYDAGADRYLLRHETADNSHYLNLHDSELTFENRKRCLYDLKNIGYQTGAGFMVGSPWQSSEQLASDMLFLKELDPQMVGIGPFIPHKDTPFADMPSGTAELTLFMLALTRLMLPNVLLPATTALGTLQEDGRERGILSGANVVMPNLSPESVRGKYMLYDNKLSSGAETAECLQKLSTRLESIGYKIDMSRGDYRAER